MICYKHDAYNWIIFAGVRCDTNGYLSVQKHLKCKNVVNGDYE